MIPVLFHAAWALVLSTYLSTSDVVFGSVVSSRRREDIERIQNVVGPCLNTIPLRVCIDWNQNMCEFIEHITDILLDALSTATRSSFRAYQMRVRPGTEIGRMVIANSCRMHV